MGSKAGQDFRQSTPFFLPSGMMGNGGKSPYNKQVSDWEGRETQAGAKVTDDLLRGGGTGGSLKQAKGLVAREGCTKPCAAGL